MKSENLSLKAIINSCYSMKHQKEKDLQLFPTKLTEKIPNPRSVKEHYQSFIRKKSTKSIKQSKIITQQPKTFEKPNIADIKSVIFKIPKISNKLSKL